MTAKRVRMRPQGLHPWARVPTCPLHLATPLEIVLIFEQK